MAAIAISFRRRWVFVLAAAAVGACGRNRTTPADSAAVDTSPQAAQIRPDSAKRVDSSTASGSGVRGDSQGLATAAGDSVVALLETGCGGGFTGGGGGTFLTADGRFYRFQRDGPPPNAKRELTFVRKDSSRAARLVQAAEREGIARIKFSEPSNMTCHLSLDRGGTSYEVAWAMGTKPDAIQKLIAVSAELEAAAR